ncbi:MAG: carboxymuconolactone decarboxylase family protein [Acidobacteria bacterium]|nr:carboxymuconolactone decarboxylase family protein [Acidobacteriota bacterium]
MRFSKPRIEPLPEEQWSEEALELLPKAKMHGRTLNIFKTLAHHPRLLKRWMVFGNHVLFRSTLPPRDRELVILRIGWLCQAEYEWGQHVIIGKQAGLTDDEIQRIKLEPHQAGWSEFDAALIHAVDELHEDACIADATWQVLTQRYSTQQMMDLIFAVGQYNLVSMALNSLGVQLDEGIPGF